MDKYNNELEACAKLKLKPGFGEFYGGNQVHITRQNDKQLEKNKYKPFEGSGNLLINNSPKTRKYKISTPIKSPVKTKNTLSPKRTSITVESNIYTKINSSKTKFTDNNGVLLHFYLFYSIITVTAYLYDIIIMSIRHLIFHYNVIWCLFSCRIVQEKVFFLQSHWLS